ncbi:MAG: sterol desaturase family protein [Alphaproteobacteria bacterium]|nr:sterol desaturase family protein [Alphaproteobacteria bacterium]
MNLPSPVTLATPAFVLLVIGEMLYARATAKAHFEARDTATSLMMGLGSTVSGAIFAFIYVAYAGLVAQYAVFDLGYSLAAFIACFVIDDFYYYWWHRISHRVRWFWADHVQHHSSQHYNLSTALRQPWTGVLTPSLLLRTPMFLLGFPLPMLAFVHGLNLVYQFWIHTEAIGKMPRWFETVMNTPSHHRVHHATNARYLDSNYAGVFIVWDRMFGTFVREDETDPPRYGIVKNLGTFNPVKVALHEWVGIAADLIRARSIRDAFLYLMAPPGWSPDGSRQTSDSIKAEWKRHQATQLVAGE